MTTGSFLSNAIENEILPGIGDLSIVLGFSIIISKTLFKFIPKKFHELLTTIGVLLMMSGYLYNILVNKFIFGAIDFIAVGGFVLIQLAIIVYIIKYVIDTIEYYNLIKRVKINR